MKLIGLAGLAGVGKDTVADILCENYGFSKIALADPIRRGLCAMLGLSIEELLDREQKEEVVGWLGRSRRELMQTLETEWGREHVADDVWLRIAGRSIEEMRGRVSGVVVSDIRFENEAAWIRAQGGMVWHVRRPLAGDLQFCRASHASEYGVFTNFSDTIIDNRGTMDDLRTAVMRGMNSLYFPRMFQDAEGTWRVTGLDQPVRLIKM